MDFTSFMQSVAQMESGGGATSSNLYGMTSQAGGLQPLQLAQNNYNSLTQSLGTAPNPFQQYMAWQQGATGGAALLNANPNAAANSVVPTANLIGNLPASMQGAAASGQLTVGQFLGYVGGKWTAAGGTGAPGGTAPAATPTA